MNQDVPITLRQTPKSARSWTLVHAGEMHTLSWVDGERLLAVSADVRRGVVKPQPFSFRPHGMNTDGRVTIFVTAEDPLELLTTDDPIAARQSHWFG